MGINVYVRVKYNYENQTHHFYMNMIRIMFRSPNIHMQKHVHFYVCNFNPLLYTCVYEYTCTYTCIKVYLNSNEKAKTRV